MEQPYLIHESVFGSLAKLPPKAIQLFWRELMVTATRDQQAAIRLPEKLHKMARELVACGAAIETPDGLFGLNHDLVRLGPAEPSMGEINELFSPEVTDDPLDVIRQDDIAERNELMNRILTNDDRRDMGPFAFAVFACVVASLDELTVAELAERTGMTAARVRKGLSVLREMGFVLERKEPTYRLGGAKIPF